MKLLFWFVLFSLLFSVLLVLSDVLCAVLLYESPGGNQVDGLPPARNRTEQTCLKYCLGSRAGVI